VIQTTLFSPPACPCGTLPVIREAAEILVDGETLSRSADVVMWCQCEPAIFNTVTEYEGWLTSIPSIPGMGEAPGVGA